MRSMKPGEDVRVRKIRMMMQPDTPLSAAAAEAFGRHFAYAKAHFFAPQRDERETAARNEQGKIR